MNNWTSVLTNVLGSKLFLRIIALFIAVSLWVYVGWDSESQWARSFEIPLQYINLQKGYELASSTDLVVVRLEGRATSLFAADRTGIVAAIDLRDLQPGKYRLPIRVDGLEGVRLLETYPPLVDVELVRFLERTVPVHYRTDGKMMRGKELRSVDIIPSEVIVRGNEEQVRAIHDAYVELSLENLKGRVEKLLPIRLSMSGPQPNTGFDQSDIEIRPPKASVHLLVDEKIDGRRIPFKVRFEGTPDPEWEIASVKVTPSHITLRHTGSDPLLIEQWALPSIDITGVHDDLNIRLALASQSEDLILSGAESVQVEVKVRRISEVRTLLNVPVSIFPANSKEKWVLKESLVSVTIQQQSVGRATNQRRVDDIPFELYVDLTNVVSNQIQLPILSRKVRDGVKIINITPTMVTAVSKKTQTSSENMGE